jgi:hypothetical protein
MVVFKLFDQQRLALQGLLVASAASPQLGTFRGMLWEGYAHRALAAGGEFRVRNLDTGVGTELRIPVALTVFFTSLDQVNSRGTNVYSLPVSKRLAAVDALKQDDMLFQITINEEHGVNGTGLLAAVEQLRAPAAACRLYFVVPPDKFASFTKQRIKRPRHGPVPSISQLVLELPVMTAATA